MAEVYHLQFRKFGRGSFLGGILITVVVHGGLAAAVYLFHVRKEPPAATARDLMVTKMVKLGKPREKFWLPRIVQPTQPKAPAPEIKIADDPNAAPQAKAAPKPEDAEISKDLRRALERARTLAKSSVPEEDEGQLTGSASGTASEASAGDEYASKIYEAIRRNWNVPTGLSAGDVTGLVADVKVSIADDGTLGDVKLIKPSGNDLYDDSCVQAIQATGKVPAPPLELRGKFRRGLLLGFEGKDLAR